MSVLGIRQRGTRRKELFANLAATDLCDRCSATAGSVIVLPLLKGEDVSEPHAKTLLFCIHHLNEHEPRLTELGATIYRKEN